MLGDFNKGVDIKGLNELVNTKSNLTRGNQVISGSGEFPGLDIFKSQLEHKKNQLGIDQFEHKKRREGIEDERADREYQDRNIMNGMNLHKEQREQEKHKLDVGIKGHQLRNMDREEHERANSNPLDRLNRAFHEPSDKKRKQTPGREHRHDRLRDEEE
jgi:hypothetical protein